MERIPSETPPRILLIVRTKLTVDCLNNSFCQMFFPNDSYKIGVSMAPEK